MKQAPNSHPRKSSPRAPSRKAAAITPILCVVAALSCQDSAGPISCDLDTPCADAPRTFCDVLGVYAASEGRPHTCIEAPTDDACNEAEPCSGDRPMCIASRCVECDDSAHCDREEFPQCIEGACVSCRYGSSGNAVCAARDETTPFCSLAGGCVGCRDARDCEATTPVCSDAGWCAACVENSGCPSQLCDIASGTCADPAQVIYVAVDGTDGLACGVQSLPCKTLNGPGGAIAKRSETRTILALGAGTYAEQLVVGAESWTVWGQGEVVLSPSLADHEAVIDLDGSAELTLRSLTVRSSSAALVSGIACAASGGPAQLFLDRSTISGLPGFGIRATDCEVSVETSTVSGSGQAGITVSGGSLLLRRSRLDRNDGGGLSLQDAGYQIENNFLSRNGTPSAAIGGAALRATVESPQRFVFNTVVDNQVGAGADASGLRCSTGSDSEVHSNIIYGNVDASATAITATDGNCTHRYSLIFGGVAGTGNLDILPEFVPAEGDYHLMPQSPGIDAADPDATLDDDFDGQSRPQGSRRDIGADEAG